MTVAPSPSHQKIYIFYHASHQRRAIFETLTRITVKYKPRYYRIIVPRRDERERTFIKKKENLIYYVSRFSKISLWRE